MASRWAAVRSHRRGPLIRPHARSGSAFRAAAGVPAGSGHLESVRLSGGKGAGVGAPARQGTRRRPADPPGPTPPRRGPRGRHHPDQQPTPAQALDRPPSPPPGPHASAERAEAERATRHDGQAKPGHPRPLPAAHPGRRHHRRPPTGPHRHPRRRHRRRRQPDHRHLRAAADDHPVRPGRRHQSTSRPGSPRTTSGSSTACRPRSRSCRDRAASGRR